MRATLPCVVDTMVLRRANVTIARAGVMRPLLAARLQLMRDIAAGRVRVLISPKLIHEYERHIQPPYRDLVRVFFDLIVMGGRAVPNWCTRWSGASADRARRCRFRREDI